jgi:hypothetical protein
MMKFLLKIVSLILNFFIYLLLPFAWLIVEIDDIRSKTEYKIVYYLMSIPFLCVFPFSYLWILIHGCQIYISERIKYEKQRS